MFALISMTFTLPNERLDNQKQSELHYEMKEFVVSIVSQAFQTTSDLLFRETASLSSVEEDLERLQAEQRRIQCFARDADRKKDHDDQRVRNWIAEINDVSCDIEDLVETFTVGDSSSCFKFFRRLQIRRRIDAIRAKMGDVLRSKQAYGIEFGGGEGMSPMAELQRGLRRSYPDDGDDDVVSLEGTMEALKARVMVVEDRLCIVSVVGMGGLGKTTLVKKVFNNRDVKLHFDSFAWVYVSQVYVPRDILSEILIQIGFRARCEGKEMSTLEEKRNKREVLEKLEEHDLIESIKNELKEKRYLVVLDDIWRIQAWDSIKSAFPKGKEGSKVLFTTRNKEVGLFADPCSYPIEPPLLTFGESLELLRRKAFLKEAFSNRDFPQEFEKLGKEMVKKCGGLPLGIVILGGLLRTKSSIGEWKSVLEDTNSYINKYRSQQEYEGTSGILALSYRDLPYHLKPCFLYLSSFPEDKEIPKRTLIQLWIAEGFVQTPRSEEVEEMVVDNIAEKYLEELVDRCMIQVSKRNSSGIHVKTYRMHDLMRDFCMSKAREENFFEIIQQQDMKKMTATTSSSSMFLNLARIDSRRIAVHPGCDFDRCQVRTHLRSLLCFEINHLSSSCLSCKNFMLLRSLELGSNRYKVTFQMLKQICNLKHLRYLGLRDTGIHKLPNSIGNLRSLRTLDLRDNWEIWILPDGISRLKQLKHLLISALKLNYKSSWTSSTLFRMNNLRYFALGKHKTWIRFDTLIRLTSLQNLKIEFRSTEEVAAVLESPIVKSGRLRSLEMEIPFGDAFPSLKSLSHCRNLSGLCLVGQIEKDICYCRRGTSLQFLPASIAKLTLNHSCIAYDPMAVLEKLPNLRLLRLNDEAYLGSEMVCSAGGFPKLETLRLCQLSSLKEWRVEKDAMPSLKRLDIEDNPELRMVPQGLKFVTTLQLVNIVSMTKSFEERLTVNEDGIEGEDFDKVRHVASISFLDTTKSNRTIFVG